jgi:DNA topoisomerase-1
MTDNETRGREQMLEAARDAGLRYVDPADPGIERVRHGRGFVYREPDGRQVSAKGTLDRIASLVIPPAWRDVWISRSPNGHIQAVGRDARGRRQYRYHPLWSEVRDAAKYERTIAFGGALPRLRRRVDRDLRLRGLPREKVVAAAVRLLDMALLRVGNEEYARDNASFGLTTLRSRHAQIGGESLRLTFRGKSGKEHTVGVRDRRLARVLRACQELPGQRLLQYLDGDGRRQHIDSDDVNDYLRDVMGSDFSAKDFRTWAGTVLAVAQLRDCDDATNSKAAVTAAVHEVAAQLGNTPAVCRACYIHPDVIDSFEDGTLAAVARRGASPVRGLRADEALTLAILRSRARSHARKSTGGQRRAA